MSVDSMETAKQYVQGWVCSVKVIEMPDKCPVPIWDMDLHRLYNLLGQLTNQVIVNLVVVDGSVFVQCESERKISEFAEALRCVEEWEGKSVCIRCEAVTELDNAYFQKVLTGMLPGRHMSSPQLAMEHAVEQMSLKDKLRMIDQLKQAAGLPVEVPATPVVVNENPVGSICPAPSIPTPIHDNPFAPSAVPKVKTFSGETPTPKGEVSYEQWRHEIVCIREVYPVQTAMEGVRRSLRGQAADMVRYLGPTATVGDVVDKLDVIYGRIATLDVLMQDFYSLVQGKGEKVSNFVSRLEGAMNHIRQLHPGRVKEVEVAQHMRERFFHGMHKGLRNSVRFIYEGSDADYYQLMRAARKTESEGTEVRAHATTVVPELVAGIQQTSTPLTHPSNGNRSQETGGFRRATNTSTVPLDKQCYKCSGWGHFKSECPTRTTVRRDSHSGNSRGVQTRDMPVTPVTRPQQ